MGVFGTEADKRTRKPLKKMASMLVFKRQKKALKTLYFSSICSYNLRYTLSAADSFLKSKGIRGKQKTHFSFCPCRPSSFFSRSADSLPKRTLGRQVQTDSRSTMDSRQTDKRIPFGSQRDGTHGTDSSKKKQKEKRRDFYVV